jgi:hypothetical protein
MSESTENQHGTANPGDRGVSVSGNISDSIVVTGDHNRVNTGGGPTIDDSQGIQSGSYNTQINNYYPANPVATPGTPTSLLAKPWNVPYPRNPFFTGREDVLGQIRTNLLSGKAAALTQAIAGLGGIGKTQTAVEYAYRHQGDYAAVLWLSAASTVTASLRGIADAYAVVNRPSN